MWAPVVGKAGGVEDELVGLPALGPELEHAVRPVADLRHRVEHEVAAGAGLGAEVALVEGVAVHRVGKQLQRPSEAGGDGG